MVVFHWYSVSLVPKKRRVTMMSDSSSFSNSQRGKVGVSIKEAMTVSAARSARGVPTGMPALNEVQKVPAAPDGAKEWAAEFRKVGRAFTQDAGVRNRGILTLDNYVPGAKALYDSLVEVDELQTNMYNFEVMGVEKASAVVL